MLDNPGHFPDKKRKWANFTLAAYLIAPLITSVVGIVIVIIVDAANRYSTDGILSLRLEDIGGILFFLSALSYLCLLIVGLPFHWMLGKVSKRKFYLYLLGGIVAPSPLILLDGIGDEPISALSILGTIGAVCFIVFWFVAVHMPKTKALKF